MPFSCSKFSLFFERVDTISEGATLDCSNGVFRHYDEKTHLCLIHKKRPLLCRVAAYYDALQSTKLSREEWYWLNEEAIPRCNRNDSDTGYGLWYPEGCRREIPWS